MQIEGVHWDKEAEVVVVGYGGAGAVAAIAAHDLGGHVLILEKQGLESHCASTHMSGGIFISPSDADAAFRYLETLYHVSPELHWTDPEIIAVWAHRASQNKEWIERLGGKVKFWRREGEHRHVPGWDGIETYRYAGSGLGLMRFLGNQVRNRGIEIEFNCPARRLITDQQREVVGVMAEADGHSVHIRARKAVILTCGGFEFNERMKLDFLKVYPSYFYGTPAATGDGVRMAMDVGADLWHMNCCSARLVAKFPDFPIAFSLNFGSRRLHGRLASDQLQQETCGYIIIDRVGRRYTREDFKRHSVYYELTLFDSQRLIYPRVPSYLVFDQRRIEAGPLPILDGGPAGPVRLYKWSRDNRHELEKGWIVQGTTLEELAARIDVPAANLQETASRYNSHCSSGHDAEFNRHPATLAALDSPPYYALALWPGGPNTQGGPRRNGQAQVLDVNGQCIPRLYAAGELGSVYGMLYPSGGGNIAECIAFGRIAAENAVQERSLA